MPLPSDLNTVEVRGKYVYLDGTAATGAVTFRGKIALTSPGTDTIVIPTQITVNLINGAFSILLPATDDPDIAPIGWTYTVTEAFDGGRIYDIDVPLSAALTGIDLSDVAPQPPATGDVSAFVTQTALYTVAYGALPVSSGLTWTGTVDLTTLAATSRTIRATLTGNVTLTLPTPSSATSYVVTLVLTQDATGSRTLTLPVSCLSAYGVDPALSTAGGLTDILHLMWSGAQWIALMGASAVA